MLKIKDNIDLKKLDFEEYSSIWFKNYVVVDRETKKICVVSIEGFDTLFDIIEAGAVEKVEEQ